MKRREFIKTAAAAAASVPIGYAYGQNAPSERVRVAVMGCHAKGRGFSLLRTLLGVPGVEVATVCDVDTRALDAASEAVLKKSGKAPKKEKDIRRVLEDKNIDGVLCAAPDHWHAPAALMTMQAGKSIYVEKPCSFNPGEGEILVEAAAKYKAIFQMGNQRRASDVFMEVVKEIHGGLIGAPRFARCWYASRRSPIGKGKTVAPPDWLDWELWQGPAPRRPYLDNVVHYNWHWFYHWGTGESGNNAPHFVDVARWALKAVFPNRVTGSGGRLFHEGDDWQWFDTQTATFEFPGNLLITWEGLSSVNARPYENLSTGCAIYGLNGVVLFRPNDTCALFDSKGKLVREWNAANLAGDPTDRANPTGNLDGAHLGDWVRCIRDKDVKTRTPADESHASILLTHLANLAARTGESIKLDPSTGKLAKGSAGAELWHREYEKGWEMKV